MNAKECLITRRSIRKYKNQVVKKEVIEEVLELTKFAPSWKNYQIARYHVVQNVELISTIATKGVHEFVYNKKTLLDAKNVCVITYQTGMSGMIEQGVQATKKDTWGVFDAGIATQQFCLSCHAVGLGTVIMGVIDHEELHSILQLPENEVVACVVVFGYPDGTGRDVTRKDIKEIAKFY